MVNIDEKTQALITDAIKTTDGVSINYSEVEFKFNLSPVDVVPLGKIVLDLKQKRFEFVWPVTTPAGNRGILSKRYEFILFFEKGKRKLSDLGQPDVIRWPRIPSGYPTEKPNEVSEILVRQSSRRGELVFDPFFGSGSVGEAAISQFRDFEGCDISEAALNIAADRLACVERNYHDETP